MTEDNRERISRLAMRIGPEEVKTLGQAMAYFVEAWEKSFALGGPASAVAKACAAAVVMEAHRTGKPERALEAFEDYITQAFTAPDDDQLEKADVLHTMEFTNGKLTKSVTTEKDAP